MATLAKEPYPLQHSMSGCKECPDWRTCIEKEQEEVQTIMNRCMTFPVADGYAVYYVKNESPLVLQWVPTGDQWTIPNPYIRGLNTKDYHQHKAREKFWVEATEKYGV